MCPNIDNNIRVQVTDRYCDISFTYATGSSGISKKIFAGYNYTYSSWAYIFSTEIQF